MSDTIEHIKHEKKETKGRDIKKNPIGMAMIAVC